MAAKVRVLIVDDDTLLCETVEEALGDYGHSVSWCTTAEEALARVREEDLDVIVTDLHMPGISGLELCERIAANRPDVPVVVLTAFGSLETAVAAIRAGAHDFVMGLPEGYETMLGERGYSLSGGQRQRIAIARAIVAEPRILVFDDATSAVEPSKEHEIRSAMSTVMEGRTTIVIAHRPGTIALADTVVLLDGGAVRAVGPHDELLASEPRYRRVLAAMEDEEAERERSAAPPAGDSGRGS